MAKINVIGDAVVVTSALKLEDIKLVQKYRPKALVLTEEVDGVKEPVFAIAASEGGCGDITDFGATFTGATRDEEKLATITTVLKGAPANLKDYLADKLGGALMKLNKLEQEIPAVLAEIAADKQAVMDQITIG